MNHGRMPFHDEQRLPPDQREKGTGTTGPPKPDKPAEIGSVAFFIERDRAFNATMNEEAIINFLNKYGINYPKKSPIMFWTMVYVGVLAGRIGGDGSRIRALIWLHQHKHMKLISWSVSAGIYSFNNQRYRLNHKLMLRKPRFGDSNKTEVR